MGSFNIISYFSQVALNAEFLIIHIKITDLLSRFLFLFNIYFSWSNNELKTPTTASPFLFHRKKTTKGQFRLKMIV